MNLCQIFISKSGRLETTTWFCIGLKVEFLIFEKYTLLLRTYTYYYTLLHIILKIESAFLLETNSNEIKVVEYVSYCTLLFSKSK